MTCSWWQSFLSAVWVMQKVRPFLAALGLAGYFMVAAAVPAAYGDYCLGLSASQLGKCSSRIVDWAWLWFGFQYADWLYLLVSRPASRGYCWRRVTAVASALLWAVTRGAFFMGHVAWSMVASTLIVVLCVAGAKDFS